VYVAADRDVTWATGWPRLTARPSGRGLTVTVTGVPGQAVTLTPVAATAAGPAVRALDTLPQDGAGPDDLDVLQVPADTAQEVLGGGNHGAELARPGRGGPHAEYHADDHDLAFGDRPDGGEGQAPARLRGCPGLDAHDPRRARGRY
jgi:hypothetical protein